MRTQDGRKLIGMLPPGAMASVGPEGTRFDTPLWALWVRISYQHANEAASERLPDERIDQIGQALDTGGTLPDSEEYDGSEEYRSTRAAMVAVVAAAVAIDGFYGMVTDVVPTVQTSRARPARHAVIVETLKRGFRLGKIGHRWVGDFEWLFDARDHAVHHKTELRPAVVIRETPNTVVFGAREVATFTPASAQRAADLALEVPMICLANPKPATRAVAQRYEYLTAEDLRGPKFDAEDTRALMRRHRGTAMATTPRDGDAGTPRDRDGWTPAGTWCR
jgi:hypothetical protein